MVTVEQLREALGDRAVGKSDVEVLRIAEPVRRLAKAIVDVYASRSASSSVDSVTTMPSSTSKVRA